jgi:hypothetical protein
MGEFERALASQLKPPSPSPFKERGTKGERLNKINFYAW